MLRKKIAQYFPTSNGKTYFSIQTERQLLFIMTVIMLVIGLISILFSEYCSILCRP
jgi:hypothetical protein